MPDHVIRGDEFAKFRTTFFEECAEILPDLEERLGRIRSGAVDREELNAVFRAVHSIKASAGAFNFVRLVTFSHVFEALLDLMRDGRIEPGERVANIMIRAGDVLAELVEAARQDIPVDDEFGFDVAGELEMLLDEAGQSGVLAPKTTLVDSAAEDVPAGATTTWRIVFRPHAELFRHANDPLLLVRELKRLGTLRVVCDASALPALSSLEPEESYLAWTFHLTTDRPRSIVAEVFEFVTEDCDLRIEATTAAAATSSPSRTGPADQTASGRDSAAATPWPTVSSGGPVAKRSGATSIRVELARIDRLVNMVGELVITQAMLAQQMADCSSGQAPQWIQGQEDLSMYTRELQECVMAIRMQPVKSVFARMPRLVREVSGKLGKQVRLVVTGEQTEVDKTVIEELADPLTHMIRNAVDHGIEDAATRRACGKPEEGTIELSASHRGGNILIQVADDGAGINRERLLEKAREKGIVRPGTHLGDDAIDNLIFAAGFSTAAQVTDVSGRGVGMDVVHRNITNLGGRIQVQSSPGRGTRFTLVLPLTLAVLDGMLVSVGQEKYIVPLTSILESIRPERHQVRTMVGGGQVISVRGEYIRLLYIYKILDVPGAVTEPWDGLVVLVEMENGSKLAIMVDGLIGQQQVVIKSLQENFDPVEGISGATILGDGKVALILDIEQLAGMTGHSSAEQIAHLTRCLPKPLTDVSPATAAA